MSYWDDLRSMAEEIVESNGLDESDWGDSISENVDGSSYIIYYAKQDEVLSNTKNHPDADDVAGMCGGVGDWQKVKTITAYMAMERDLFGVCREVAEEDFFTCEECSQAIRNSDETEDLEAETGKEICHPCFLRLVEEAEAEAANPE